MHNIRCARIVPLIFAVCSGLAAPAPARAEPASRPNIVIVLADDLGYGDLGCYGNKDVHTPHLDRFATEGLRLTHCYSAAPNCSPARAGLMTGRTPYRVGIHNWIPMFSPMHLRKQEITIATLLRQAGYATCQAGKWHLNGQFNTPEQPQPRDHGFDHWFATQNNALPNHRNPDNFVRNGKPVGKLKGYAGLLVADEAVRWLTEGRDRTKPFFLYMALHEPHEPIATAPEFSKRYPSDDPSFSAHHGNISQMDAAFGRLMTTLDEEGLRDSTLVIFTSDNGPAITRYHPHGSTGGLRDKKGSLYEGGIRVPAIIRWPRRVKPGTVSDEPTCGVDMLPTLCEITGVPIPNDRAIDGTSLVPLFSGHSLERTTPLYWQLNRAHSRPKVAMRVGDWKVLAGLSGPALKSGADLGEENQQAIKTAKLEGFELYNLKSDPAESKDLAESEPDRLSSLVAQMRKLHREICDESPIWPDWTWPRYEAGRIEWPDYSKRTP